MTETDIADKIANAPKGGKTLEFEIEALKYFTLFPEAEPKDFTRIAKMDCIPEARRMKYLLPRLIEAGLDPKKL